MVVYLRTYGYCLWMHSLILLSVLVTSSVQAETPDWTLYQSLLNQYATPGSKDGLQTNMINYHKLKSDPRLNVLVKQLEDFPLQKLKSREDILAFYLNAYNILAIKMVVDNWPVRALKSLGTVFRPVWNNKAGKLGGKNVTLGYLEHKVLRKMNDPRVHVGLNCASMSCPDVRLEAYQADKVYKQLDEQARLFLQQAGKGAQLKGKILEVSSIFGWFKKDFLVVGGYEAFIRKYRPGLPADIKIMPDLKYNWSVNTVLTSQELRNINVASLF